LALVLVLLSGLGPVFAWRRTTAANLRRSLRVPTGAGLVTLVVLVAAGGVARRPAALAMFCLAAFVLAVVGQEFWRGVGARRAVSGESPPVALTALVRRNRRRYGGYLVHLGVAILFVGVAASSAFQHARDVRLAPGQSARVGGYEITYVRPTSRLASEKISLGAVLDVRRHGRHVATLRPTRGYYPSLDQAGLGTIGRFFDGQATSEVGLKAGLRGDLWTAVEPDLTPLQPFIDTADRRFANAGPNLQGFLIAAIVRRYQDDPPPATFRLIASPLVTWIWLGALVVAAGGLVALWPAPLRLPVRVRRASAAPVAGEPERASA
jgi:cytochrome c-type biogenesis protein CcmF